MFVLDARRVVLVFNRGCEQFTGWMGADLIGKTCHFHSEPAEGPQAVANALVPPQSAFTEPLRVSRSIPLQSGGIANVSVSFFPLMEESQDAATTSDSRVLGIISPLPEDRAVPDEPAWHGELTRLVHALKQRYQLDRVVAVTPAMQRALARTRNALHATDPVHFTGEPGTGREHLARCLHQALPELVKKPFVPLDCRRLTHFELKRTLDRAFDPEVHSQPPAGTLFLRNIAALARDLQVYLLHSFKQQPLLWRVSSCEARGTLQEIDEELFLTELSCLLTTTVVDIPNLRDRLEELPLLAQQIVEQRNQDSGRQVEGVAADVLDEFRRYQWPGHVRELVAVIGACHEHCTSATITPDDLPFQFKAGRDAQTIGPRIVAKDQPLEEYLAAIEKQRIQSVLAQVKGNKTAAAEILGLPRPRLYRRLEALGLLDESEHDA